MRILMISPHPTYSPRGTPISVLNRCRALCALGHQVDLVTYGIGTDVEVTGLRWRRAPVPGIHAVGIGPSLRKLPLDLAVFLAATARVVTGRRHYDVIHTHEEAGLVGALVSRLVRLPHVYDMGNDLSVVLQNYGFSRRHVLTRIAVAVESMTVRGSDSVIAHFPSIAQRVGDIAGGSTPATVVANVPIEAPAVPFVSERLRQQWSPEGLPIVLYTGTLERYQGVPTVIEAAAVLNSRGVKVQMVIVGGTAAQQQELNRRARELNVQRSVAVVGAVDQDQIRSCLDAADILLSPRAGGSNTPLKLFSYMHSGKPLLATRILAHTQVLDDSTAALVEPTAVGIADGVCDILANPRDAADRAKRAKALAQERFGIRSYIRDVADAYLHVGGSAVSADELDRAQGLLHDDLVRAA